MKRCGWLIIALFALQSVAFGALCQRHATPVGFAEIGFSAECDSEADTGRFPLKPHAPAQPCCLSCAASGACGAEAAPPAKAEVASVERSSSQAFSIGASLWTYPLALRLVGWSTTWSSRAPPSLS
ncbi:MAG: hypothetical protein ACLPSW_05000 [Roseiarcus sp.]